MWYSPALVLFAVLGVSLPLGFLRSSPSDPETLLRGAGQAAFDEEDMNAALGFYQQAEGRTTDPGRVALARAAALFRLGEWATAEKLYRCCLDPGDPRRPQALLGLGACQLQAALIRPEAPDRDRLLHALLAFDRCLALSQTPPEVRKMAQQQRARSRLLLIQLGETPPSSEQSPGDDMQPSPPEPDPPEMSPMQKQGGSDGPGEGQQKERADPQKGEMPRPSEASAGVNARGELPPISDEPNPAPISAEKASEHLRQATERILDARTSYRRRQVRPPPPGVRDW